MGGSGQGLLEDDRGLEGVMGEIAGGAGECLVKHARHVLPMVALQRKISFYPLAAHPGKFEEQRYR